MGWQGREAVVPHPAPHPLLLSRTMPPARTVRSDQRQAPFLVGISCKQREVCRLPSSRVGRSTAKGLASWGVVSPPLAILRSLESRRRGACRLRSNLAGTASCHPKAKSRLPYRVQHRLRGVGHQEGLLAMQASGRR